MINDSVPSLLKFISSILPFAVSCDTTRNSFDFPNVVQCRPVSAVKLPKPIRHLFGAVQAHHLLNSNAIQVEFDLMLVGWLWIATAIHCLIPRKN